MEEVLEIVKKAVADYDPDRKGKHLKAARALLSAIVACRRHIAQNTESDRECAQRMARELDELLSNSAAFRDITADKKVDENLHNLKPAEEHLDSIQDHLKAIVKEQQEAEAALSRDWVKSHPVFSELKQWVDNPLPKSAYILLFRQKQDNTLELITQSAQDGRIFTRLRPHEFGNDLKLHRNYRGKSRVVGAAVLAEKELLSVIGKVPQPEGNKDQMQTLLGISSKAAGRPADAFMEVNAVLKELNELSHRRKLPKDAYILLFQAGEAKEGVEAAPNTEDDRANDAPSSADLDATGEHESYEPDTTGEEEPDGLDANGEQDSAELEAAGEQGYAGRDATDEQASAGLETTPGQESAGLAATGEPETAGLDIAAGQEHVDLESAGEQPSAEQDTTAEQAFTGQDDAGEQQTDGLDANGEQDSAEPDTTAGQEYAGLLDTGKQGSAKPVTDENLDRAYPELVTRQSNDGKIITRFWPSDFVVKHKVFDIFRSKPAIVGAAVIKRSELCQAIGRLPQPRAGQSQLDALLQLSRNAVERPVLDYLEENEVLKSLHELSTTTSKKDADVVLFLLSEQGRLEIMPVYNSAGQSRSRIPLTEFQSPKAVHDRFAGREKVVGASVIGAEESFRNRPAPAGSKGAPDRSPDRSNRRNSAPETRPVVFAAFGRTPLKTNLMCTPDTLKRLGLNLW